MAREADSKCAIWNSLYCIIRVDEIVRLGFYCKFTSSKLL